MIWLLLSTGLFSILFYIMYQVYHFGQETKKRKHEIDALKEANKVINNASKQFKEIDQHIHEHLADDRRELRNFFRKRKGDKAK